jgi:DNA-binding CsgD family transcriptional regulator
MTTSHGTEFEIHDPNNTLTPRQREVLVWVVEGKDNGAIGILVGITLGTVKFHLAALMRRFDASTRGLLISRVWDAGLVRAQSAGRKAARATQSASRTAGFLLLAAAMGLPGTGNDTAVVRTPRTARVRVTQRRGNDDYSVIQPMNLEHLRPGDREAA